MNIKQKCKEFNIKSSRILSRYVWFLPIIETLIFLPVLMLYITNESAYVAGNFNVYISSLSYILFRYGITKNLLLFVVMGFVPFILKMISGFFILKKKRWAYFSTMVLYLLDFIASLVVLCTNITPLQEWNKDSLLVLFAIIWITPAAAGSYYGLYIDNFNPEIQKTPRCVKLFFCVVFALLVAGVSISLIEGNKKIASESEVATLNRCYEYSQNYLYEQLPDDKDTLEKMQSDIEEVFSKELFFIAFNQSAYFDRLKTEQKATVDLVDQIPIKIKSEYANELMYLKCKILLKLDKDEEYINYYAETRKYFSWTTIYSKHLNQDNYNFTHDDYDAIEKGCIKFLESDALEYEKVFCITDYGFVISKFFTDEERKTKGKELIEKYIPEYENLKETLGKEFREWEAVERSLYMLK